MLMIAQLSFSQVKEVVTDLYGNFVVEVRVGTQGYISINQRGRVVETNMQGELEYYSDFNDYEAGKVKKQGILNSLIIPDSTIMKKERLRGSETPTSLIIPLSIVMRLAE